MEGSHKIQPTNSYRFRALGFFGVFFAEGFAAGLAGRFAGLCAAFAGFALGSGVTLDTGFALALASGLAADAGTAATGATTTAAFPLPFATSGFLPGTTAAGAPAAAFGPRPRRGGGGGGGGGGANGFRNFKVSVRERSFPSSSSMNTSRAILGYSGNCGVISSSVISGSGSRCCTCRHLVRKFLIFCATVWFRAVTARNRIISGRAPDNRFHVREGVAASF